MCQLYIDPGTGGMLFTVLFGILSVVVFSLRALLMKLKFSAGGGKAVKANGKKIPIVVFTDHKRYWNVFEPLLDEFEKRHQKVVYYTCSKDDPIFDKKYEYITGEFLGEGNRAFTRLNLLNAGVVLSTTPNLDVFQWKRSPNTDCYIYISHNPNDITMYRMFALDHYDALILSGDYQVQQARQLEKLRGFEPKDIEICGLPFMDEMKKRLETAGKPAEHERTVLLAPTWGENGLLTRFGDKVIDALISTGYKIIVRPHPQSFTAEKELMDRLMSKYQDSPTFSWNRDNDNFEVLRQSDILISDFSGVIFDYALIFDKPLIYTETDIDLELYDASWLDETPWTLKILPDLGLKLTEDNVDEIKTLIDKCIEDSSFAEGRDKARAETWEHIGEGTKRSVDFVMNKYNEVITKRNSEDQKAEDASQKSRKKFSIGVKG